MFCTFKKFTNSQLRRVRRCLGYVAGRSRSPRCQIHRQRRAASARQPRKRSMLGGFFARFYKRRWRQGNTWKALSTDGPVLTSPGPHAAISTRCPRNNCSVSVRGRGFRRKTPHRSHFQITVSMTKHLSLYRVGFAKRTFSGREELRRTMSIV